MKVTQQALAIAQIQTGQGAVEDKAQVMAWDRLNETLPRRSIPRRRCCCASTPSSLRRWPMSWSSPPPSRSWAPMRPSGWWATVIGHGSLLVSVVSCGFAFPVINVQWDFFGMRLDRAGSMAESPFDDAALHRTGRPRRLCARGPLFLGVAAGRRQLESALRSWSASAPCTESRRAHGRHHPSSLRGLAVRREGARRPRLEAGWPGSRSTSARHAQARPHAADRRLSPRLR